MYKAIAIGAMAFALTGCVPTAHASTEVPSACTLTNPGTVAPKPTDKTYMVLGPVEFQTQVACVLEDDRSWAGIQPVGPVAVPDFIIFLGDGAQAVHFCGSTASSLNGEPTISCTFGNMILMNENKWNAGTKWRIAILNHEVGHMLGHDHGYAAPCSVMTNGDGCPENWWPPLEDSKLVELHQAQSN